MLFRSRLFNFSCPHLYTNTNLGQVIHPLLLSLFACKILLRGLFCSHGGEWFRFYPFQLLYVFRLLGCVCFHVCRVCKNQFPFCQTFLYAYGERFLKKIPKEAAPHSRTGSDKFSESFSRAISNFNPHSRIGVTFVTLH